VVWQGSAGDRRPYADQFNFRAPAVAKAREASEKISNFPGLAPRFDGEDSGEMP
jgi:hypothetical protein